MKQTTHIVHEYLRSSKKFPHMWCPGCGHGIALSAIIRAIHSLEYKKDDVVVVSGIGCSSRMPVYMDFNTVHSLHGRAITFATGIKLANKKLKVIVITGDGDSLAIGGNHFIHAARRNIDITTIILNNSIYGMTGGQYSPATPKGSFATTAPYSHIENPFKISELAIAAGAGFVARSTVYHALMLTKLIEKALDYNGFSVVETITQCQTQFGKLNKRGTHIDMMKKYKENGVRVEKAEKMTKQEMEGKFSIGVLKNKSFPTFTEQYELIRKKATQ